LGLLTLRPVAPPPHALFLVHFVLVSLLLIYFPFSKLLHAGGIFFSPTRNQPYDIQRPPRITRV
jgi:nitrate reductase gamma subunit